MPVDGSDTVVTADHSTLTQDGLINLDGDVLIEQPGRRITTDIAELDQTTGKFELESGMRLESDRATFIADNMSGQTRRKEGSLQGVRYSLFDNGARGNADYIFLNQNTTTITNGTYTTCARLQWLGHARRPYLPGPGQGLGRSQQRGAQGQEHAHFLATLDDLPH